MKNYFFILLFTGLLSAQPKSIEGIIFEHTTWSEAIIKAKKERKLVMLDAYASWCGPCKWMSKNIFPKKEVGDFYNKNFVNVKMDMEKGEGIKLAEKLGVTAYPTFYFIDATGKVVHQVCGGQEAEEFIDAGKNALNPEVRLSGLEDKFNTSPKDSKTAMTYFDAAEKGCVDVEPKVKKYTAGLDGDSFLTEDNFQLVERFISDFTHVSIQTVLKDYDKFTRTFGKERIDTKLKNIYGNALQYACRKKDEKSLQSIQLSYRAQKNAPNKWLDDYSDMLWADAKNDTTAYFNAAIKFCDSYLTNDWQQLNALAWTFYERTNNAKYLHKAGEWASKSIDLQKTYANLDTYAALLYKMGKLRDAKTFAEEAVVLGRETQEDVKETELLLDKINAQLKH